MPRESFKPEIPIQELANQTEAVEKKYEVAPEFIEEVEKSGVDNTSKVSLLLVKAGLKPSSSASIIIRNNENVFLTDEELEKVQSMIKQSGLYSEFRKKETDDYYLELANNKTQKRALEQMEVLIGKSQKDLDRLKNISERLPSPERVEKGEYSREERNQNHRELGLAYGYPPTAVEAFVKYMEGDEEAYIRNDELPEEIRENDAAVFSRLFFKLSREHWQEEIKQGKIWADAIKLLSPKIYEKAMEESEELREFDEKEKRWRAVENSLKQKLGPDFYYIEQGIRDAVIALNVFGVNTRNSCEGHHNHGRIVPWISFGTGNPSPQRYIGQELFERKVREENGIPQDLYQRNIDYIKEFNGFLEEMRKTIVFEGKPAFDEKDDEKIEETDKKLVGKYGLSHKDIEKITQIDAHAVSEAVKKAAQEGILSEETEEYKKWKENDQKVIDKARNLLDDFYRQTEKEGYVPDDNVRLILYDGPYGHFIRNEGGGDYVEIDRKMTNEEKENYQNILEGNLSQEKIESLKARIESYITEFQRLAEFLEKKFFESQQKYIIEA